MFLDFMTYTYRCIVYKMHKGFVVTVLIRDKIIKNVKLLRVTGRVDCLSMLHYPYYICTLFCLKKNLFINNIIVNKSSNKN